MFSFESFLDLPLIWLGLIGTAIFLKSVTERYGRISDQELLQAIDRMTFDHGDT